MVSRKTEFRSPGKMYEREARQERSYELWAFDVMDDAVPALHGQSFVTVG
jgi:hypothetical protein